MLAYADGNYAKAERMTLNKDEVVDCVLSCGIKGGYPSSFGEDDEAVEWLDNQPEEVQQRVIDDAFPFTRYGL